MHKGILEFLKKFGYKKLHTINKTEYVYKKSDFVRPEFNIAIEEEYVTDDIYIYGWIIQQNFKNIISDKNDHWIQHWKRRLYITKKDAIDALNQYRLQSVNYKGDEYRIKPLYSFRNSGWRNHIINKIINEKK